MLIYNNKKEFIGIDESDLNKLGFASLSELQDEVSDFADLFLKEPGFVHNFKHVNWIDFVECADSTDGAKVLIGVNSRNFKCQLTLTTVFLTEEPSSKAYLVHLNNMFELTDMQTDYSCVDLVKKSIPEPKMKTSERKKVENIALPEFENIQTIPDKPMKEKTHKTLILDVNSDDINSHDEKDLEDALTLDIEEVKEEIKEEVPIIEKTVPKPEVFDNGYIYNPSVASSELGLPVDLIEEFIEDFIAQAKEFQDALYVSLANGESDKLKILSHKLKGVAANLRIEDALETLTTINTSDNNNEIQKNLDILYKIISKLSNKKIQELNLDDDMELELELESEPEFEPENKIEIEDIDVPLKINLPELADDDFFEEEQIKEERDTIEMLDDDIFSTQEMDADIRNNENQIQDLNEIEDLNEIDEIEDFALEFKDAVAPQSKQINYNKEDVANEIGLDKESFNELLEEYIIEANTISTAISKAIETDNSETWVEQALTLKAMNEDMKLESFNEELNTLINTTQKSIAHNANEKISEAITQISNMED